MANEIRREIVPMTQFDSYTINKRIKSDFDYPLHFHEEYELNYIYNAPGAKRVIGDHMGEIGTYELVLVGSNMPHAWFNHNCKSKKIEEVTIQIQKDLFDEKFLKRTQMSYIKNLLDMSTRGVLFSMEITAAIAHRIDSLPGKTGFDSMLELFSILHDLAISPDKQILSGNIFNNTATPYSFQSRRVEKALQYMHNNFGSPISLSDVAMTANMSEVAFSRFFKQKTGTNFIDSLTDIRLGHAARMLIETTHSINEIAYHCGFNNISNFNRIFKKKKNSTPKDFRSEYLHSGSRVFV